MHTNSVVVEQTASVHIAQLIKLVKGVIVVIQAITVDVIADRIVAVPQENVNVCNACFGNVTHLTTYL